jgi:hypothetical protein
VNPALRVVAIAIAAAAGAAVLFPIYLSMRAGDNKVFEPQPFDFALSAVATFVITVGAQIVPWKAAPYVAFVGMLCGAAFLFGILGAFGIGLAVLPVAIVVTVLLYRALRRGSLVTGRPAAIGGALAGYGAVLLYIVLIIPATFECTADGRGSASGQRWERNEGTVTISSTGSVGGGSQTGTITSSTSIATFRCEQGRIVEFRRVAR